MKTKPLRRLIITGAYATCLANAQTPAVLSGKISEVTVYQGSALVSRVVDIPDSPQAPMEVVVSGLPSATDSNSVYADQAKGVEIRSVAFRTKTPVSGSRRKRYFSKSTSGKGFLAAIFCPSVLP